MSYNDILICILLLCITSFIPRILPIVALQNKSLPEFFQIWLRYIPTAVFGALIFTAILGDGINGFRISLDNKELLASLVVLPVAARTRSLPYSIISGLISYWLLQQIM